MTDDRRITTSQTRLAHAGLSPRDYHGFVNPPVVHASTVLFPDATTMATRGQKYTYGTHGTPTTDALATAIDELEGSAATVLLPSGLTAVTLPLLAFLRPGDHALFVDTIYGPARRFADGMLRAFGVSVEYFHPSVGAGIAALMRPETKVVYLEAPGSNTFEMQDVPAIAAVARARGAVVMMDNTWATPLFFRPLDHGVDVSIHAATKYLGGHSDLLLGSVSAAAEHAGRLLETVSDLGLCIDGDTAYLALRGLRTMGLRLERHQASALEIARWLEARPEVARVLHPALESHPDHALWRRDFRGASGVFSFVLKGAGVEAARAFLDGLRIFGLGYSWGGFESLAVLVDLSDRTVSRVDYGGAVVRLQIGIEEPADLLADLEAGFAAARRQPSLL